MSLNGIRLMNRRLTSLLIIIAWMALILALIPNAPRVFNILVYSDSKVLPSWTEASIAINVVNRYLGNQANPVIMPVYVGSLNNSQYVLSYVDDVLRSMNLTYYDLNEVYDKIIKHYDEVTNSTLRSYLSNYTGIIRNLYINESSLCSELYNISELYYSTYSNYTLTIQEFNEFYVSFLREFFNELSMTDNDYYLTSQVINNVTSLLSQDYPPWLIPYINYFTDSINESVGYLPIYELNITIVKSALHESYSSALTELNDTYAATLRSIALSNPLAMQVIALGPNPPRQLVAKLVAYQFLNSTPPLIRPYLTQLACSSESQVNEVINELNSSLKSLILTIFSKPPYSYANNVTNGSLYSDGYSIVVVNSSNDELIYDSFSNYSYAYPFSASIVLTQLSRIVESDVPIIDEVSGILVLAMLLFVLGTLVAPLIILAILVLSYGAVLSIVYILGKSGLTVYYLTVYMISPIVFGIGVDYSLLVIGRYLEERRKGLTVSQALDVIRRSTIPTILTSGSVVAAGLGSFVASTYQYIQVIGLSYIITVIAVVSATTIVLPSVITLMSDRVLWPMGLKSSTRELSTRLIIKLTRYSLRRPWVVISVAAVLTILSTIFIMTNPITSNPILLMPNTKPVEAYKLLLKYFPSYIESTQYVVIEPSNANALSMLMNDLKALNFTKSISIAYNSTSVAILKVITSYNALSDKLIPVYLRLHEVANKVADLSGVKVIIGGDAANKYFFVKVFENQFYGEIAILIVILNIVILSLALRSLVVPLRLVTTVMMSITWSLAISQLIFYKMLGVETYWLLPIILYALLMSVGTDYDVFIVTRVREEVIKGRSDADAILVTIENTGPIVTGAALVLAVAFMSLMTSQLYILKEIGLTVGLSVIIDAFIIRPMVMPAIMILAGKYNWWPTKLTPSMTIKSEVKEPEP